MGLNQTDTNILYKHLFTAFFPPLDAIPRTRTVPFLNINFHLTNQVIRKPLKDQFFFLKHLHVNVAFFIIQNTFIKRFE